MPYEIDKTLVISQKMIDKATADGTLFMDVQHNLLIDRIKNALGTRYVRNTVGTITVRVIPYENGLPTSPEPDVETLYYLPQVVVNQLDRWVWQKHWQKQKAGFDSTKAPFVPTCEPTRFSLRYRPIPTPR